MARKPKHEDHTNHEAWAIPYGDLITLLLAFFVVMYAVSSVNEGKYRVLADSLSAAFGGPPRSLKPVQIGDKPEKGTQTESLFNTVTLRGFEQDHSGVLADMPGARLGGAQEQPGASESQAVEGSAELRRMADAVQQAMRELIQQDLVIVRRTEQWLEIEIKTDILFPSGSARLSPDAVQVLERLAAILRPFPHALRIEGHTDNVPIATREFPSNWELSAARAASVVHLFMHQGIDAQRMTVVGLGEYHPAADNLTAEGRNRNRRVVVAVIGSAAERREVLPAAAARPDARIVVPPGTLDGLETQQ
ncbi:MAG: flagellar motor protein MotD [Pseudomonadota bacterium]